MKVMLAIAALVIGFASATPIATQQPEVGSEAPEVKAAEWFNNIGGAPSLESLRGQTVLIEFWATW